MGTRVLAGVIAAWVAGTGCASAQGAPAASVRATEGMELARPGVTLRGTLEVPAGRGPHTVALIIAGSGPTDRDGNSPAMGGANNSLKMLAEGLAAEGIASLRYDKRGIGSSAVPGMSEADLRFTTYSDDAAAWVEALRKDPRFNRVVIIGHSEGALLGTLAAQKGGVDKLVLVAGGGRPIGDILREQLKGQLQAAPALYQQADSIMRELEAGRAVTNVPAAFQSLFRPAIQPYMISWLPLDPAAEVARADIPTLVVQGTTDIQVNAADADRLGAAGPKVRKVMVEGMNHVLKLVSGTREQQIPSYSDPSLPIAPELLTSIVAFIRSK